MCLFVFPSLAVDFLWSHTTESMCVGYMSAQDGKAKVRGESWVGEGRRGQEGNEQSLTDSTGTSNWLGGHREFFLASLRW